MVLQTVIAVLVMGGLVALPSWALHRAARWGLRQGFQLNVGPLVTALPSVGIVVGGVALVDAMGLQYAAAPPAALTLLAVPVTAAAPPATTAPQLPPRDGAVPSPPVASAPSRSPSGTSSGAGRVGSSASGGQLAFWKGDKGAWTLAPVANLNLPNFARPGRTPAGTGTAATGADEFADVETALKNLVIAHAAYVAPDAMKIGRPQSVTLELGPAHQVLDDIARFQSERGGQVGSDEVKTAPLMRAQLTGSGFDVEPKDAVDQWVSLNAPTAWSWSVTASDGDDWFPRFSTRRELDVSLSAVLKIDGSEHPRVIKTWEKKITVDVGVPDWLHKVVEIAKDVWWLWLLLAAIVGYVLHRKPWPAPEAG